MSYVVKSFFVYCDIQDLHENLNHLRCSISCFDKFYLSNLSRRWQ